MPGYEGFCPAFSLKRAESSVKYGSKNSQILSYITKLHHLMRLKISEATKLRDISYKINDSAKFRIVGTHNHTKCLLPVYQNSFQYPFKICYFS